MHSTIVNISGQNVQSISNFLCQYLALLASLCILHGINHSAASMESSKQVKKQQSDEERLLDYLFEDYNPSARPVLNSSKTVPVDMMFSLMHMQELVSLVF